MRVRLSEFTSPRFFIRGNALPSVGLFFFVAACCENYQAMGGASSLLGEPAVARESFHTRTLGLFECDLMRWRRGRWLAHFVAL